MNKYQHPLTFALFFLDTLLLAAPSQFPFLYPPLYDNFLLQNISFQNQKVSTQCTMHVLTIYTSKNCCTPHKITSRKVQKHFTHLDCYISLVCGWMLTYSDWYIISLVHGCTAYIRTIGMCTMEPTTTTCMCVYKQSHNVSSQRHNVSAQAT